MKRKIATLAITILLFLGVLGAVSNIQLIKASDNKSSVFGLKSGDWAKYEVAFNYTSDDPNPPVEPFENAEIRIEVLEVDYWEISFEYRIIYKNGTEKSEIGSMDLVECRRLTIWFIPGDLYPGNATLIICPSPLINQTLSRKYCGALREVNYVYTHHKSGAGTNHEATQTKHAYYDRKTGILDEVNIIERYTELTEGYETHVFTRVLINETNVWEPRWTVDDDGPADFQKIQEAINIANPGDTIYVRAGTYYEHVRVNKSVSLIGENKETTIIDGNAISPYTVFYVIANNVTISGFTIRNSGVSPCGSGEGIYLCYSNKNNISNNILSNNYKGILLWFSKSNAVADNTVLKNSHSGIDLGYSQGNMISNNIVSDNRQGISLGDSSNDILIGNTVLNNTEVGIGLYRANSILRGNSMVNNKYNFYVGGRRLSDFVNDVDTSNTVDGKPIYYWVNKQNMAVPLDAGCVVIVNCTCIIVQNLNLTRNGQGILLDYTTNSTITKNNVANNEYGIWSVDSSSNTISGNKITNNTHGIVLGETSKYNIISENEITANNAEGIRFDNDPYNNIISGNNVANNEYGIRSYIFSRPQANTFYHNNFINNTQQVDIQTSGYANFWDNGLEGNYWSDYTGTDSDRDGIGDSPYIINENNADHYPLMSPISLKLWPSYILVLKVIAVVIAVFVLVVVLAWITKTPRKT